MEKMLILFVCVILGRLSEFAEGRANFLLGKYIGNQRGIPHRPGTLIQDFSDQYFQQQLDHFEPDLRTWAQRFWDNDKYYKPGGPVFVMIGGEGPENPIWMAQGQWIAWAKQFRALCLMLEHRFYGKSHPTKDLSVDNLRYLSSKQALADLANFVTRQMEIRNITNPKVIVFGGSYPGSLSAWFRLKYPHIVHAAISSSAPLLAQENFSEYVVVVKKSLAKSSPLCVDNIQAANIELENALRSQDSATQLADLFQLCEPVDVSNKKDLQNLVETLAGNFEDIVQYNRDNRRSLTTNITIDTVCGIMMDEHTDSALEGYARVNKLLLNVTDQKCLNFTYTSFLESLNQVRWTSETSGGGRQWMYQTCTEFGYYQTSDSCDHPFAHMFPLKFFVDQCQDLFGLNETIIQNGIAETNRYYGARNLDVNRVVFVNGDIDPWHMLGITKKHGHDAPAILIKGAAHCADMYPSRETDIPELKLARVVIEFFLQKWI